MPDRFYGYDRVSVNDNAENRIEQAMPGWRSTRAVPGAGYMTDPAERRLGGMNVGDDPPGYGPAMGRAGGGVAYQREANMGGMGSYYPGRVLTPAEQDMAAREFERLHGGGYAYGPPDPVNRRVNRAFHQAGQARPRAVPVPGLRRIQLDELGGMGPSYYDGLNPNQRQRFRQQAHTVPGAAGAYGRPGSGGRVGPAPYQGDRVNRVPAPTGQTTWARDPLTGAFGPRQVLGSPQDEALYADWKTGGRSDSSFSTGVGAGSWR